MELFFLNLVMSFNVVSSFRLCLDYIDDLCQLGNLDRDYEQLQFLEQPIGIRQEIESMDQFISAVEGEFRWFDEDVEPTKVNKMPIDVALKKLSQADLDSDSTGDVADRVDHITQPLSEETINTDSEITSIQAPDPDTEADALYAPSYSAPPPPDEAVGE